MIILSNSKKSKRMLDKVKNFLNEARTVLPDLIQTGTKDAVALYIIELLEMKTNMQGEVVERRIAEEELKIEANIIINKLKISISDATNDDGKKMFSNETARNAQLQSELIVNKEYREMLEKTKAIYAENFEDERFISVLNSIVSFASSR